MSEKQSSLLIAIAPVVFSLLIGGIGGYYVREYKSPAAPTLIAPASGGSMGSGGGMGGGMMGGMGGGQGSGGNELPQLVRNLVTLEKLQNKGLDSAQSKQLLPILKQVQSADKLSEDESASKLAAIQAVLTDTQKQALQGLQPTRPGGGMGGMMGRGGGMGGRPDPEHPFASERNKQALEDLITSLQHS